MGAMQRRKGAGFENEICAILRHHLGVEAARKLGQARDGGDDIAVPRRSGGEFRIECKRRASIACEDWLKQAERAALEDFALRPELTRQLDVPMVIMRADRGTPMVLMRLGDFLPLLGNEVERKMMPCPKCAYVYPAACGPLGCPNCLGDGLK